MDELRGPTIQIVLHVKEGLGFGFLKTPFIVGGSLNGYMLETDPAVPCHAPFFDAELVWEADKRRFRNLRVQNVPVKVEVYTTGTQGRKDKVGYMLLSLLGAQPCPSNKVVDVRYSWHKLLGVKSEGKCCHPQLLLSLSVEDRNSTPTPRNEMCMFHSNEVAYPTSYPQHLPPVKTMHMTVNEYLAESKKTVTSPELQPRLLSDEGLIQIGDGRRLFVLSFVIGSAENVDLLLPDIDPAVPKETHDCYLTYSVFNHNIMTDRVAVAVAVAGAAAGGGRSCAHFNQRTSLRLRTDLDLLSRYFAERPLVVVRLCAGDRDVGICSMDLRKLVPTPTLKHFLQSFCNTSDALTIHERCYLLCADEKARGARDESRRAFVDLEMTLRYVEKQPEMSQLTARSATQLESARDKGPDPQVLGDCKSGSCTNLDTEIGGAGYTNMSASNTNRYRNAGGDAGQTTDIAAMIRQMCESFASSQQRLLADRLKPATSDMQVQCEVDAGPTEAGPKDSARSGHNLSAKCDFSKSDTYVLQNKQDTPRLDKDTVKRVISAAERDEIMKAFVDELEDWKEKQQELYKCQLERKEQYHLELLAKEWAKKRVELECKLTKGIEQCRNLSADLSRATEEFRLKGYRSTEREKKVVEAKKALEQHYTAKFQELREASQQLEEDQQHQLRLKDMRIEELQLRVAQLEKQVEVMKNNLKNSEKENEIKYSGLTKDQTASLIQELRCLEEKLDSALQSKAFFKEQWGRAVRELHFTKLSHRRQLLAQLRQDRRQLQDMGLETILDDEGMGDGQEPIDVNKLKDDYYMDILANTPGLDAHSVISPTIVPEEMEMYNGEMKDLPKNPVNEKLNELIAQRDRLIQEDNPDEPTLKRLNHEIRSLLLNFGT